MIRTKYRLIAAVSIMALASLIALPAAFADHGEGHNGETLELSKSEGLEDGEVVTVTLTSWLPGNTATVVTCYKFPASGPTDCELSNYGTYAVTIAEDGTGMIDYPVSVIPLRCDADNPCFVVAGDGFVGANFAAQEVTFAAVAEPEPEPEPELEPEPEPVEEEVVEPEPEPEVVEEEPEPEPGPEVVEEEMAEEETAAVADDDDDDGSGFNWIPIAVIIPVVIVVVLIPAVRRGRQRGGGSAA